MCILCMYVVLDDLRSIACKAYLIDIDLRVMISNVIFYGLSDDAIIMFNWYLGCIRLIIM